MSAQGLSAKGTSVEVRAVISLALLYAFRMLGLFMALPVLILYGAEYIRATPFLLGVALGIYGLTQAIFQIPLGWLSDILGRKPVIVGGLVIFALGSIVAATSSTVEGLILGRALQGMGAIASAIMATVSDFTSEKNRTKAMAAIGASIGVSFAVAMVLGASVAASSGLSGVFILSAIFAVTGIGIVLFVLPVVPQSDKVGRDTDAIPSLLRDIVRNKDLARLNIGIFSLHAILMASFVVVPVLLETWVNLEKSQHWKVYVPVLLLSFIAMLPLVFIAERKGKIKSVFLFNISLVILSLLAMAYLMTSGGLTLMGASVALFVFFVGFNLLEATLPSMVSKLAPAGAKGTAMGVYSTSQFLGAFAGGALGGAVAAGYGYVEVLYISAAFGLVWLCVAVFMKTPRSLTRLCVTMPKSFADKNRVLAIEGVEEVRIVVADALLHLKIDKERFNRQHLNEVLANDMQNA